MAQDRIARIILIRAGDLLADRNRQRMVVGRAAFRDQQVVIAVPLVDVRPFGPDPATAAPPQVMPFSHQGHFFLVQFLQPDFSLALELRIRRHVVADVPGAPVVIEKQRGIDAGRTFDHPRFGPATRRVVRGHDKIHQPAVDVVGGNHIETALVATNRRGMDTVRGLHSREVRLIRAVECVADQRPVDQVAAVIHGYAGKIFEGRIDEIVVVAGAADRGVRRETGDDRIAECRPAGLPGDFRLHGSRCQQEQERSSEQVQCSGWRSATLTTRPSSASETSI